MYNFLKCPLCRVYIQKSSGCYHVICNQCNTSFCYRCGGLYNLDPPGTGGYHRQTSILGYKDIYKENDLVRCMAVRGGYFEAKLAMLTGYRILFLAGLVVVVMAGTCTTNTGRASDDNAHEEENNLFNFHNIIIIRVQCQIALFTIKSP